MDKTYTLDELWKIAMEDELVDEYGVHHNRPWHYGDCPTCGHGVQGFLSFLMFQEHREEVKGFKDIEFFDEEAKANSVAAPQRWRSVTIIEDIPFGEIRVNFCDYGHGTAEEVRLLPTGGGGNTITCRKHYEKEMQNWREENRKLSQWGENEHKIPKWEDLKVYSPE